MREADLRFPLLICLQETGDPTVSETFISTCPQEYTMLALAQCFTIFCVDGSLKNLDVLSPSEDP